MRKLLLSIAVIGLSYIAQSQVICAVQAPAATAGNKTFTWADPASGWGTPDFLIPGTFIMDTLVLVNDGTPGTNATYGNLLSEEGCVASPANAYAGKICVIRRNTCEFGSKAKFAQDAGAIGVIIINRDNDVISMGAGAEGANVTIPVAMLSSSDGNAILAEMLTGDVVVLLGNKTGLFDDDAGIMPGSTLISKSTGVLSQLSVNGTEFNFDLGTRVYNYGLNDQTNIMVTANIDGPGGSSVYSNTVGPISIVSGDSVDIFPGGAFEFPPFSLATYPAGRYTLTYDLDLGIADEYDGDNLLTSEFVVNDEIFSYAQLDPITNLPVSNNGYRPSTNNSTFSTCMVIENPNASRVGVEGIYFQASTSTGFALTGEEISLNLYRWEDVFVDLNDAGLAFDNLTSVAFGYYYYPNDSTAAAALQGETVLGAFTLPVLLEDSQRFLACAQTVNLNVFLGHDTKTNYLWNEAQYLQPLTPNESDGTYYASGFGMDTPSSMGLKMFDASEVGIDETAELSVSAYPNPANDKVTISLEGEGDATLTVTDVTGKVAMNNTLTLLNGKSEINISSLEAGVYIFNLTLENGQTSQFNIVKK